MVAKNKISFRPRVPLRFLRSCEQSALQEGDKVSYEKEKEVVTKELEWLPTRKVNLFCNGKLD